MNNWNGLVVQNRRLYNIWINMIHRCENPNRQSFKNYGARGIKVCHEWHQFDCFLMWAKENGYRENLTLDRIDNDSDYNPNNCQWSDAAAQSRNKRTNVSITINGIEKVAKDWSEDINVSEFTVYWWISHKGIKYAEERIRDALQKGFCEKESSGGNGHILKSFMCSRCGAAFNAWANYAKRCPACRIEVRREKDRRIYREKKHAHCGKKVEVVGNE